MACLNIFRIMRNNKLAKLDVRDKDFMMWEVLYQIDLAKKLCELYNCPYLKVETAIAPYNYMFRYDGGGWAEIDYLCDNQI